MYKVISQSFKDVIVNEYVNNKMSTHAIARKYNVSDCSVSKWVRKAGYKVRTVREGMQLIKPFLSIDEKFFEKIDSKEKAQILGMYAADGCLHKTQYGYRLIIALQANDKPYLDFVKNSLKFEGETKYIKKYNQYSLSISNLKVCQDIFKLGIIPRKSLTLKFPTKDQVPDEFLIDYVRGFFEGDGCFSYGKRKGKSYYWGYFGICTTKEFGEKLIDFFYKKTGLKLALKYPPKYEKREVNAYYVVCGGIRQTLKLMKFLYEDNIAPFVMNRKYTHYLKCKKEYEERIPAKPGPKFKVAG